MSRSPLKFSLAVSLFVHGLAIGGVAWFGFIYHRAARVEIGDVSTLELVAAPVGALSQPEETIAQVPPLAAPPAPQREPTKESIPTPPPEPALQTETSPPASAPAPQETVVALPATTPSAIPAATVPHLTHAGDNSAPTPGENFTTVTGTTLTPAIPDATANLDPEYPLAARRRGQQGTVLLSLTVSATGDVTDVAVMQSSGYELLDQKATQAAKAWKFTPAYRGKTPVESKLERPIRFKLTN